MATFYNARPNFTPNYGNLRNILADAAEGRRPPPKIERTILKNINNAKKAQIARSNARKAASLAKKRANENEKKQKRANEHRRRAEREYTNYISKWAKEGAKLEKWYHGGGKNANLEARRKFAKAFGMKVSKSPPPIARQILKLKTN